MDRADHAGYHPVQLCGRMGHGAGAAAPPAGPPGQGAGSRCGRLAEAEKGVKIIILILGF